MQIQKPGSSLETGSRCVAYSCLKHWKKYIVICFLLFLQREFYLLLIFLQTSQQTKTTERSRKVDGRAIKYQFREQIKLRACSIQKIKTIYVKHLQKVTTKMLSVKQHILLTSMFQPFVIYSPVHWYLNWNEKFLSHYLHCIKFKSFVWLNHHCLVIYKHFHFKTGHIKRITLVDFAAILLFQLNIDILQLKRKII